MALVASAALVGLVLIAYRDAPLNGFQFDDERNIGKVLAIHIASPTLENLGRAVRGSPHSSRVLPNVSFALDWWRGGGSPAAFQQTNVAIHALAALAAFWLLCLVTAPGRGPPDRAALLASFLGAALWALHPIQVQGVTYIVQRMASLAALFSLVCVASALQARRATRRPWPFYALALVSLAAGCLSKENAWLTPLLLLLAEFGVHRREGRLLRTKLDRLLWAIPAALAAGALLSLLLEVGPLQRIVARGYAIRDFTLLERLLTQPRVVAFHLTQIAWPLPGRFSIEHTFPVSHGLLDPPQTLFALLAVALWCAVGVGCFLRPGARRVGFWLLWLPATLVVESSVIPLEMVFEHRMYLPSVGLAGLAALLLARGLRGPRSARGFACALAAALIALFALSTRARVPAWRSTTTLYRQALTVAPGSARAHTNFGRGLEQEGDLRGAEAQYAKALSLDPRAHTAHNDLGALLAQRGELGRAVQHFQRAIAAAPSYADPRNNLGNAYAQQGRYGLAEQSFRRALAIRPRYAVARCNLAKVFLLQRRLAEARACLEQALRDDPDLAEARALLERARRASGAR